MSDDQQRPASDQTEPAAKAANTQKEAARRPKANAPQPADSGKSSTAPTVADTTYGALREENRVVMRHTIALNIESFRPSTEEFTARPQRIYRPLQEAAAPFVSVIVPNFNGQHHLVTLLDALGRQTFTDFEVILADDASTDDSVALVERSYPSVRLLVNRRNLGFVGNCNAAADAGRGRILVLLNNDTEPDPEWLAELVKTLLANPQAGAVASKLLLFDDRSRLHSAGDQLGSDGLARNRGVWERDFGQYDQATRVFSACGGAAAYRRDVWQALGGFDEDFWMYLEDVDLSFRARLAGWETVFAPKARVYHHLSASGGDRLSSFYVGRNSIWLIAKNMPRGLLLRNLPQIVTAQARIALDALRNIRGEAARSRLRGQLAGILGLPAQLRKRRLIQSRRQLADRELAAQMARE